MLLVILAFSVKKGFIIPKPLIFCYVFHIEIVEITF